MGSRLQLSLRRSRGFGSWPHLLILSILFLAAALPAPAAAQRRWRPPRARMVERVYPETPRIGAMIGVDVTQLHMSDNFASDYSDSRTGPRAGVLYSVPLQGGMPLRFETGLIYERKGGELNSASTRDVLDEHYLTFPALLEIPLAPTPARPFLKIGPELSILISGNGRTDTFDNQGFLIDTVEYDPNLHDLDVGLRFGGGLEFPLGYTAVGAIEGAYVFGLPNVSEATVYNPNSPFSGWPNMQNRTFQLSFTIYGLLQ